MTDEQLIKEITAIDWEFASEDTQYLTHNIHRYSGKFIPQIAAKAIELLTTKGDVILDSYAGSGTTLLEAALHGRNSIGVDINPLAILISKAKTTAVTQNELNEIYEGLIPFIISLTSGDQMSIMDLYDDRSKYVVSYSLNTWRLSDEWNCKWYQKDVLAQLVQIYSYIDTIENESARDIALVAFSDILRKSSNASSKYPNVMFDKNAKKKALPAKAYLETLTHVVDCVLKMSTAVRKQNVSTTVICHNNLHLPIGADFVDAVISHPPYIAAVPYAEYGSLSLTWLGYDKKKLDGELTGGKRHSANVVLRFCEDYQKYFVECYRVLKKEHYMFLMVGNPVAHGKKVDLSQLTEMYAINAGFKHVYTAIRHGQNRRGNKMGDEYLLFFKK